jgi:hypothetical protein
MARFAYRYLMTLAIALVLLVVVAACSSSSEQGEIAGEPTEAPAVQLPAGPTQVTERIEARSTDGILFDLKLALPVFDQNGANGRRDDVEVITPDKTEYQGVFANGPGTLFIVSCLADVCQTGAKTATFEVHYWVEEFPDPIPDGVDILGG